MTEVETSPPDLPRPAMSSQPTDSSPLDIQSTSLTTTNNTTTIQSTSPPPPSDADPTQKPKRLIRRKRRPARPQVDPSALKSEPPPQTGTIFNIWYNKWSGGDREDKYLSKTHAPGRCNISTDSGYTRGDKVAGSYFCLFFARGVCPRGHECEYLHRLPGLHDLFNPNVDSFGRDKHSDYRDDMGGVGTFMRQNRTLYVGRIHVTDDIEEVVARHFAEWGQVDRIRVLTARGVAFVTYTNEANSQFAKEAMAHQSLDHNEILNVRWATVDPNPMAQKREARRVEEQAAEAVRRALPEAFVREIEGRGDGGNKRRKRGEEEFALEGYEAPDEVWYSKGRGGMQVLEDGGERFLIEDGPAGEQDGETKQNEEKGGGEVAGGILSSSTLAALKSYSSQTNGKTLTAQMRVDKPFGPLVGYGSEDDSD